MPIHEDVRLLKAVPLFSGVPDAPLQALIFSAERVRLPAETVLFRAGETDDAAWLIRSGTVRAEAGGHESSGEEEGATRETWRLGQGAFLGEMAMIARLPHHYTVTTQTAVSALKIDNALFQRACREFPELGRRVLANALARLENSMRTMEEVRRLFETARSFD